MSHGTDRRRSAICTSIFRRGSEQIDVLNDLSLEVPEGEFLALMGPSRLGQDDAAQPDRRPGPAQRGRDPRRRRAHQRA